MLPDTAFPGPLPLSRPDALALLDQLDEFDAPGGVFFAFVMIPVEERLGEYRFAGATTSLTQAIRKVDLFIEAMGLRDPNHHDYLRYLLVHVCEGGYDAEYQYPTRPPVTVGGPHRLVLCVQSPAPYDHFGVCIVEAASLAGSGYEGKQPETDPPDEWNEG